MKDNNQYKDEIEEFFHAGKNYTTLGCCGGDYCYEEHDQEIRGWLQQAFTSIEKRVRSEEREKDSGIAMWLSSLRVIKSSVVKKGNVMVNEEEFEALTQSNP